MELKKLEIDWLYCSHCGHSPVTVKTTDGDESWLYDGDEVECPECHNKGSIDCYDNVASVVWDEGD